MSTDGSPFASIDESARRRFESGWRDGQPPSIEDCLPPRDSELFLPTLEELVLIELEFRWRRVGKAGSPPEDGAGASLLPSYFERFKPLNDRDVALQLIEEEFLLRHRHADGASVEDYEELFPQWVTGDALANAERRVTSQRARQSAIGPGAVVEGYRVQDEFARGGFGRLFTATDQTLGRTVAMKQLSREIARDPEFRQRFLNEARITAYLEHPGVVPIYALHEPNADEDAAGAEPHEPFYTMKLVQGDTLGDAIAQASGRDQAHESARGESRLAMRRLLEAFLTVTRTMAFAHDRGVIHRDLKPANILLGAYGETVILDWGLAKRLGESDADVEPSSNAVGQSTAPLDSGIEVTQPGSVMGTPVYMSPEQAEGSDTLDQRTDVYALGAILYETLTGKRPFDGDTSDEVINKVKRGALPRPRAVNPAAPRALEAVCLKAMARDAGDRYRDAGELAADIERYLADQPVEAHREGVLERLGRASRRHRKVAVVGAVALLLITAVSIIAAVLVDGSRRRAQLAEQAAVRSQEQTESLLAKTELQLYVNTLGRAAAEWEQGRLSRAKALLDSCAPEHRHFAWRFLKRRMNGYRTAFAKHSGAVMDVTCHTDGKHVVSIGGKRQEPSTVWRWDMATGEPIAAFDGFKHWGKAVAVSPDGKRIAAGGGKAKLDRQGFQVPAGGHDTGEVCVWDAASGKLLYRLDGRPDEPFAFVTDVAFTGDGERLAVATFNELRLYESETGKLFRVQKTRHDTWPVDWELWVDPRANRVLAATPGQVAGIDSETGERLTRFPLDQQRMGQSVEQGGALYLTHGRNPDTTGFALMLSLSPSQPTQLGHPASVTRSVFHPTDATWLATGSIDGVARVWNNRQRTITQSIRAEERRITALAYSPDGRFLITGGDSGIAKVWDTRAPHAERSISYPASGANTLAVSPDGAWLVDPDLSVFDTLTGKPLGELTSEKQAVGHVARLRFTPDGEHVLAIGAPPNLGDPILFHFFDATKRSHVRSFDTGYKRGERPSLSPNQMAFLSGNRVAFCGDWKQIAIYRMEDGKRLTAIDSEDWVGAIGATPRHPWLLLGDRQGTLRVYDVDKQSVAYRREKAHDINLSALALSPDGKHFVSGDVRGGMKLWGRERGEVIRELTPHAAMVSAIRFSHDGKRFFSVSNDRTLRVWHMPTGQLIYTHAAGEGPDAGIFDLDASADDTLLVYGSFTEHVLDGRPLAAQSPTATPAPGQTRETGD